MGRIKEFILNRGFTLMLCGFSTALVGVLLCWILQTPRYAGTFYPQAAVGLAFLGLAVYIVGRVSVGMQHNANKRKALDLVSRRDDESFEPPARPDGGGAGTPPGNNGESGAK